MVLDRMWFNGRGLVGIVLIRTDVGTLKAYIGTGQSGNDEMEDINHIKNWGTRFPKEAAKKLFPQFEEEKWD